VTPHRIALHAAQLSSHGHPSWASHPADLTTFSARTEFSAIRLRAASTNHPHGPRTPPASARGPPELVGNP
jgi:hypothetical protein